MSPATNDLVVSESLAAQTAEELLKLHILTPDMVDTLCKKDTDREYLVDDFLPDKTIGIGGGDSTIGKSPWFYMLGLCVASGLAFMGHKVRQGGVLYYDLENTVRDSKMMRDAIMQFLGLKEKPAGWLLSFDPPGSTKDLEKQIAKVLPSLVILDTLREFSPQATSDNTKAAELLKELRRLARTYGCVIILIHHMRKPRNDEKPVPLSETKVVTWLQSMEGPRAFTNQTDVRIALEEGDFNPAAIQVKWNRRVVGDSPLTLFERAVDEETGDPIGYRHLTGTTLLNPDRRKAFENLPGEFSFQQAKAALEKSNNPTNQFLEECRQFGLIEKVRRGHYRKLKSYLSTQQGELKCPT